MMSVREDARLNSIRKLMNTPMDSKYKKKIKWLGVKSTKVINSLNGKPEINRFFCRVN